MEKLNKSNLTSQKIAECKLLKYYFLSILLQKNALYIIDIWQHNCLQQKNFYRYLLESPTLLPSVSF